MKKYIAILLVLVLMFSLVSCKNNDDDKKKVDNKKTEEQNKVSQNEQIGQEEVGTTQEDIDSENNGENINVKDNVISSVEKNLNDNKLMIEMHYPTLENTRSIESYDKVNKLIDEFVQFLKTNCDDFVNGFKESSDEYPMDLIYNLTYNVTLKNAKYLSIQFILDANFGGPHPDTEPFARTFDIEEGKEVVLGDIFNIPEAEYKDVILKYVMEQSKENFKDDEQTYNDLDQDMLRDGIKHDSFYIKDNNLVIFYYSYDYLCYAVGNQEFSIPLDAIKDKLKIDFTSNTDKQQ